jgi:hypothetical protein
MIQKQLNKNTTIIINQNSTTICTTIENKFWQKEMYTSRFGTQIIYKSNVCEHCDDMDDVKYMDEADACLCFNCREAVGLEIMADEQWEDTKRSLMGVI